MNRHTLGVQFSTPTDTPWKTLVLEAHPGPRAPAEYLAEVFSAGRIEQTEDVHLHEVDLGDDVKFTVDDSAGLRGRLRQQRPPAPPEASRWPGALPRVSEHAPSERGFR